MGKKSKEKVKKSKVISLERVKKLKLQKQSKSLDLITPAAYVDTNEVVEWAQRFGKYLCLLKKEPEVPPPSDTFEEHSSWEWMLKAASDIIITNGDKKSELLLYLTEINPGIHIFLTFFCDKKYQNLYLKIFIILRECVNPRNKKVQSACIKQTLECPYLLCCLQILSYIGKDLSNCEEKHKSSNNGTSAFFLQETMLHMIWFLSAVSQRDPNFASSIGKMCKVKFLLRILKNLYFSRAASYYPVLKILRKLSKNSKVATVLGKNRVMNVAKKMFGIFNNQPSSKFQMFFDILVLLTKEKFNCRRFLSAGCLIAVISSFQQWTSWKGRGLMKMCKSVLSIYSHLALTTVGRKALLQSSALTHIKKFCESCPVGKGFDDIMMRACAMLTLCHNAHKLPVNSLLSPARFDLPILDTDPDDEDSGTSSDEDNPDDPDIGGSDNEDDMDEGEEEDADEIETNETESEEKVKKGDSSVKRKESVTNRKESPKTLSKLVEAIRYKTTNSSTNATKKGSIEPKQSKLSTQISRSSLDEFSKFFSEFETVKKTKLDKPSELEVLNSDSGLLEEQQSSSTLATRGKEMTPKELKSLYAILAKNTRSVIPFVKLAYPDMTLAGSALKKECLLPAADRSTLRNKVLTVISRASGVDTFRSKVIYDLDAMLSQMSTEEMQAKKSGRQKKGMKKSMPPVNILKNNDEKEVGIYDKKSPLKFESRFESGNLRKVIQIGPREFNLVLTSDVNSTGHNQWFYFQISNMLQDCIYTFNIINCIKGNSQFNFGMQPVVFSISDAVEGNPGWVRSGFNICYFKNGYRNLSGKKRKAYYTASFSLTFTKKGDIVYIAYHIPYTYTRLMLDLQRTSISHIFSKNPNGRIIRSDILCQSLNKNDVPVITVTGANCKKNPIKDRQVVFITARVHPGETNASWVMLGFLNKLLLSPKIEDLLKYCIFKVIPMLNVEGVINGCHRCGLTAEDLNRRWKNPKKILHPTIYNTKMLIEYSCKVKRKVPLLFCDLHGHSRKKNVFLYGCSRAQSWQTEDRNVPESIEQLHGLPLAISRKAPAFSFESCNYDVRKNRETTARVTFWRDFNIVRSYTLECSYCGMDRGDYKGLCIGTKQLIEVGESLCESVEDLVK